MSSRSKGFVHSFQSLGTLDGPGVRFVVFLQGCNLRCGCCHNPDTWVSGQGKVYTPEEILEKASRYREYFAKEGGITLSGGEPLLQAEFATEVFALCKKAGIHTCLDTSGSLLTPAIEKLLSLTDRVLLDIKYTTDALYRAHVGCPIDAPLTFLDYLNKQKVPVTLRQVIIPTLNDTDENILALRDIAKAHTCVDKIELLPFRKICQVKYDKLNIPFPMANLPEPTKGTLLHLESLLKS